MEGNKRYRINLKGRKTREIIALKQISGRISIQFPETDTIPATPCVGHIPSWEPAVMVVPRHSLL